MKILKTLDLRPGMYTAAPVRTKRGQLIANEDVELTEKLIARISFYGIDAVCVDLPEDPMTEQLKELPKDAPGKGPAATVPKGNVQEPTYSQRVKKSETFLKFQVDYSCCTKDLKNSFSTILSHQGTLDTDSMLKGATPLLSESHTSIELFDLLHNIRTVDDSIYAHCMNVAMIASVFGKWMNYSESELNELTLCGLLHDIGKAKIPPEILNKPGKYTEDEFRLVKMHPKFGYDMLKDIDNISTHVKLSALMHHERCDGSGYPSGCKAGEIDDYAQIIAIADVYDAMTAARSYRSPLCPFQVIEAFEQEGLQKYNPKYILTFLEHIASTYQNNRVLLNDGRSGDIILLNSHTLSKPVVQLTDGSCVDLSHTKGLSIQAII